eukprot:SAG22_NODE_7390_length_744_cov_1.350388_1_plen_91_part_00
MQVAAECVLARIDAALLRSPPVQRCLAAFNCSSPAPGLAAGGHDGDCFLRCSYAVVGGGRHPALISSAALLGTFEAAFNATSDGGCERIG